MAWTALTAYPLAAEPAWYCGNPVAGGKIYAGGNSAGSVTNAYVYDPATDAWTAIASNNVARSVRAAAIYVQGKVYLFGGNGLMDAEVYDVATNTWSTLASMPKTFGGVGLSGMGFSVRSGGVIYVGPFTPSGFAGTYDHGRYNIATDSWTLISGGAVNTDPFILTGTTLGDYGYMMRSGDVARLDMLTGGLILPTITGGLGTPNQGGSGPNTSLATFGTKLVLWSGGSGGNVHTLDPNTGGEPYAPADWTDLGSSTAVPTSVTSTGQPWNGDNIFLIGRSAGSNFFYKLGITPGADTATSALDTIGPFRHHPRWPDLAERWVPRD